MKKSGLKILVILSHAVVIIALMLPLLILSGSFDGGHRPKDKTLETPQPLVGGGIKPLTF